MGSGCECVLGRWFCLCVLRGQPRTNRRGRGASHRMAQGGEPPWALGWGPRGTERTEGRSWAAASRDAMLGIRRPIGMRALRTAMLRGRKQPVEFRRVRRVKNLLLKLERRAAEEEGRESACVSLNVHENAAG
jgi:hypothetical protein